MIPNADSTPKPASRPPVTTPWRYLNLWLALTVLAGCATPYVHPRGSHPAVPALHEDHAIMDDGYALPLRIWRTNPQPQAIILALHGMNDYSNAYAATGAYLARHHITTYAYDQRGFGASAQAGLWHGGQRMIDDLTHMARLLRARHPRQPLYLMGESMGGAILLSALAGDDPPPADGVILLAPAVWARDTMPFYQRVALWLTARIMPGKRFTGEGLKITPSDNIEMLRALGRDPLFIKATRVDVIYGVTNLMDRALQASAQLDRPALILYGERDEIIPKRPTCRMFAQLPDNDADATGRRWDSVIYPNGYHMLIRDLQQAKVLNDILAWIERRSHREQSATRGGDTLTPEEFCAPSSPPGPLFDDSL